MKITDNFLNKSEFENINKTFHLSNFPWYFMPFKVYEGDDNYQFYHLFVAKGKVLSKHFDILHPILKKLGVKEIIRIKANLTLKQKEHINLNLIYFKSPIGKALIGKDCNDMISVETPSGERNFEILKVDYI